MRKSQTQKAKFNRKKVGFTLPPEVISELELRREAAKKDKDSELDRRLRAIILVATGTIEKEAAAIVEVSHRTIQYWIAFYRMGGVEMLMKGPYPGKKPAMTAAQKAKLKEIVLAGPENYGLDTGVWTAPVVGTVIKKEFSISYSSSQIRRILHALGFSMQYPKQVLSRADKEQQKTWLAETLPALKKKHGKKTASSSSKTK